MMYRPCNAALLMLASATVFGLQPAAAEEVANALAPAAAALEAEPVVEDEAVAAAPADAPVPSLADVEQPATTVDEWVTQMAQAERVEITNIQIEETADGVTLRLETTVELAAPETAVTGNAAVADIPNAVLNLPGGNEFSASDPAEGIALVDVSALPGDQVRVAITGTDAPPAVNITAVASGLVVTAAAGVPTAEAPDDAIQIVVTGEQDGYLVPNASTATRTDTPLRDIPQSIQVIPRQVIEDQQAIGLEEVLANAAGVNYLGNTDGLAVNYSIRGFDNIPVLRDGFRLFSQRAEPETANLERVEVLRGPASVLLGESQPGGVVNLVTKQPLAEPYYNIRLQGGNGGFVSPSVDLSGPLTEDGRLLYRLNALYRREDGFRDFDSSFDRFFIAPTLAWQISDRTDLTVNLEYLTDADPYNSGTVAFGDGIANIPPERLTNNPRDTIDQDYLNVGYTLEHRFSNNWQLRNQFRYANEVGSFGNRDGGDVIALPTALDETTGILRRLFASQTSETDTYGLYTNVQGEFSTGSVEHTLLFGIDLAQSENRNDTRVLFGGFTPVNIFDDNPDYF
ncbi:MAG: TonB-dependent receptor plug domain-containing protein, partial [Cyanobacteria bacterium P01_D01_bin.128]